jgi:hypothetical protein
VIRSGAVLDLQSVPLWALWVFVGLGGGFFAAVLFWMMPPALRRGEGTVSVAVGIGLFLLIGLAASRAVLWPGAVGFQTARRGRFAGLAIVVLEVCVIVLSDVYVRGV